MIDDDVVADEEITEEVLEIIEDVLVVGIDAMEEEATIDEEITHEVLVN